MSITTKGDYQREVRGLQSIEGTHSITLNPDTGHGSFYCEGRFYRVEYHQGAILEWKVVDEGGNIFEALTLNSAALRAVTGGGVTC